jgi:phosphatidate cytidylyltransferase
MNRYLRSLTPDQQMNWLFGLVLCMLLLASAVAWLLDWRDSHQIQPRSARPNYDYADMVRRSWWMSMIFWVCWVCGPVGATILFALVSFLTLREYISLTPTHRSDHRTLVLIFFIILPLQYALLVKQQFLLFSVLIPVYAFLAIPVFSSLGNEPKGF